MFVKGMMAACKSFFYFKLKAHEWQKNKFNKKSTGEYQREKRNHDKWEFMNKLLIFPPSYFSFTFTLALMYVFLQSNRAFNVIV